MEAAAGTEQRIWFESSHSRGPDGRMAKMHLNCLEILYLNAKQTNKPSVPLPPEKMCLQTLGFVILNVSITLSSFLELKDLANLH